MFVLSYFRRMLPAYYTLADKEKDYICSQNDANGMHSCFDLPPTQTHETIICNATANMALANGSCINWNHYYTECKSQGENPFQGTISFDNIGLAWVAIFVVSIRTFFCDTNTHYIGGLYLILENKISERIHLVMYCIGTVFCRKRISLEISCQTNISSE